MFGLIFLYASWLPFLLVAPWLGRRGGRSLLRLALVPLVVGAAVAIYTAVTLRIWPRASIRIDLLFLMPVVGLADAVGAAGLFVALRRSSAARLSAPARWLVLTAALAASGFVVAWAGHQLAFGVETSRLVARMERGRELLAEARARDRERSDSLPQPPQPVAHLGAFSWVQELPRHRALTQLELWREEDRLFGFLIRATPPRGQETLLFPVLLEDIELDPQTRKFAIDTERGRISGRLSDGGIDVELTDAYGERRRVRLGPRARVEHEVFRLAPRSSYEAWIEWAESVVPFERLHWSAGDSPAPPA